MKDLKQARHLLKVAEEDMAILRAPKDPSIFIDRMFGWYVQQVAETSLKAWICLLGQLYPCTHDLSALLQEVAAQDEGVERFADLADYTDYAGKLRYVPFDPEAELLDRERALALVEALLETVQSLTEKAEA